MHSIFDPANNKSSESNSDSLDEELHPEEGNETVEEASTGHYQTEEDTWEVDTDYDGHYSPASAADDEDDLININLAYENARLLEAYNQETNRALVRYTREVQKIEKRMQDMHLLNSELLKIKEELKRGDKTNLDQYEDLIERFQQKHWPALRKEHNSVIDEAQNPFPEGFDIEGADRSAVDNTLDKFAALVKLDESALTDYARKLQTTTDKDSIFSQMATNVNDGGVRKMVDNMGKGG